MIENIAFPGYFYVQRRHRPFFSYWYTYRAYFCLYIYLRNRPFPLLFSPFPPRRSSQSNLRPSIQGPARGREKGEKRRSFRRKRGGKKFHLFHLLFFARPHFLFAQKKVPERKKHQRWERSPPPPFFFCLITAWWVSQIEGPKKGAKTKSLIATFSLQKFLAFFCRERREMFPNKLFVCFFFFSLSLPLLH